MKFYDTSSQPSLIPLPSISQLTRRSSKTASITMRGLSPKPLIYACAQFAHLHSYPFERTGGTFLFSCVSDGKVYPTKNKPFFTYLINVFVSVRFWENLFPYFMSTYTFLSLYPYLWSYLYHSLTRCPKVLVVIKRMIKTIIWYEDWCIGANVRSNTIN